MATLMIYSILFFSLFGNSLFRFGIPQYFAVGTELLVIALFIVSLLTRRNPRRFVPHLWYSFFFMVLITICSIVVNGSGFLRAIFSLRLLYRFYFFYLGIITLGIDDWKMKRTNLFVGILLLLQFPVVALKFSYYGINELTIGAYAEAGGTVTTMLPIVVIFYLAGYYFLHESNVKHIIIAFGFVLLSIVGKKRAVAFLYPLQFLAIYYYIYIKGKGAVLSRKAGALILLVILILVVSGSIFYFNDTLNPEATVGGSVDVEYALEYAIDYSTRENAYGYSGGRLATATRTFRALWDSGFAQLFFGLGPGLMTSSVLDSGRQSAGIQEVRNKLMIGYGVTTMTRIAIEYGGLGVITFSLIVFLLARMCWRYYKYEVDPYWRAFAAGSVGFAFSMVFFAFAYAGAAFWGDTMPVLYFYAMGVVYTRLQRIRGSIAGQQVQPKAF